VTYFLNFRTRNVGGAVTDPVLYQGDGTAPAAGWSLIPATRIPSLFAGKNILFATHGFNVSQQDGANALGLLDAYLQLASPALFVGMLWPGDCIIPIVDYPFEGSVAMDCGARLARFCDESCASAQSLSFASHSLGARFVLHAVENLTSRKAQSVCMAAAAINRNCLTTEYATAANNAERISLLASREDDVLKIAFTLGDPFADLLHDDHTPFQAALGAHGPPTPASPPILSPWQISNADDYGHSDYLPPTDPARWPRAADFFKRAFLGQSQTWPT
jgi:Alpha/beta hydrolase of unknown function (DUF900)